MDRVKLKQARQMGMNMPFLGGDGWDSPTLQKLAGKAVSGNYISSHFAPDDKDPKVQNFVKEYKAEYGQNPGAMAALGYDGILVMAEAIASAKSTKTRTSPSKHNSILRKATSNFSRAIASSSTTNPPPPRWLPDAAFFANSRTITPIPNTPRVFPISSVSLPRKWNPGMKQLPLTMKP